MWPCDGCFALLLMLVTGTLYLDVSPRKAVTEEYICLHICYMLCMRVYYSLGNGVETWKCLRSFRSQAFDKVMDLEGNIWLNFNFFSNLMESNVILLLLMITDFDMNKIHLSIYPNLLLLILFQSCSVALWI